MKKIALLLALSVVMFSCGTSTKEEVPANDSTACCDSASVDSTKACAVTTATTTATDTVK